MIDGPTLQSACVAAKIQWIAHHRCALCDVMVGYIVQNGELFFDGSCACTTPSRPQPRSWDATAGWIEMQDDPVVKARLLKAFGVQEEITTEEKL